MILHVHVLLIQPHFGRGNLIFYREPHFFYYTPNGYIVPAKFDVHFLPLTKNVNKRTKLHLNEIGLNNTEFYKSQSQLRQPPISWKIRYFSTFCNTGVRLNITAMLCILCKYACTIFKG